MSTRIAFIDLFQLFHSAERAYIPGGFEAKRKDYKKQTTLCTSKNQQTQSHFVSIAIIHWTRQWFWDKSLSFRER